MLQKLAPYRVTPTPTRAPKRPAAPTHKEESEDQHDRQSEQRRIKLLDVKHDSKSIQPTVLKHELKWQDDHPWADFDVQFNSQPIQPKHEYKWQDEQVTQQFIDDWTKDMGEQEKSEETTIKQQNWSDEQGM